MLEIRAVHLRLVVGLREIDGIVLSRDAAGEDNDWLRARRKFRADNAKGIGLIFRHFYCATFSVDHSGELSLKGSFYDERRGQPYAGGPGRFENFDTRRYLERAPTINRGIPRKNSPGFGEREA